MSVINGINLTEHLGLIGVVAHKYRWAIGGCIEADDLFQAGFFGLLRAAEKFEPERGIKFSTYAVHWVRQAVRRAVMNERRTVRIPVHAQVKAYQRGQMLPLNLASLDAHLDPTDPNSGNWLDSLRSDADTDAEAAAGELSERVGEALAELPERQRRIVKRRFWREFNLNEIGSDEGVSRERARQLQEDSLKALGRLLRSEAP